jgi:UDP-N-acetylmuramoyl-tripeptide--D-alanyl-D-alanine ligase
LHIATGLFFLCEMSISELHEIFLESTGISTDSRKIWKDCIYLSLKGDRFNGNNFALQALSQGASFSVIDQVLEEKNNSLIKVENGLQTLQNLAAYHRAYCGWPTLGITGSNGKTTTKELIGVLLASKYRTLITEGNLNNHIGVPLTVLKGSKSHEIAVIEMGASHPGNIKVLCEMADPDLGLITNIGKAHLEGMGGISGVLKTKGELFDHILKKEGKLLLNSNQPLLADSYSGNEHLRYGSGKGNDIQGHSENNNGYLRVVWKLKDEIDWRTINTNLVGNYNLDNVLSAITVGIYFGVDPIEIAKAIEKYIPTNNRSELEVSGTNRIIWDAYNANPSSMTSALTNVASFNADKLILILGEMNEVGETSLVEHQSLIDEATKLNPTSLILIGESFRKCEAGVSEHFSGVDGLVSYLSEKPLSDSLILVKGSRSNQLEKLKGIL